MVNEKEDVESAHECGEHGVVLRIRQAHKPLSVSQHPTHLAVAAKTRALSPRARAFPPRAFRGHTPAGARLKLNKPTNYTYNSSYQYSKS